MRLSLLARLTTPRSVTSKREPRCATIKSMAIRWFNILLVFIALLSSMFSFDVDGQHDDCGIEETTLNCPRPVAEQQKLADCRLLSNHPGGDLRSIAPCHSRSILTADFLFLPRTDHVIYAAPSLLPPAPPVSSVLIAAIQFVPRTNPRGPPRHPAVLQSPGLRAPPNA